MATSYQCEEVVLSVAMEEDQLLQATTQKSIDQVVEHDCLSCGKRSPNMKSCTRCSWAKYCDRSCQRKHWKQHKMECSPDLSKSLNFKDPAHSRMISTVWSEFARLQQGEHEMEFMLGEDTLEGCKDLFARCKKNPGHKNFIPVTKLNLEHLPYEWRHPKNLAMIKDIFKSSVRLLVRYTSPYRPDSLCSGIMKKLRGKSVTRFGSGWIELISCDPDSTQLCPLKNCSISSVPHRVSQYFRIMTAAHVVFDDSEAKRTTVEFFYDDETDRSSVVTAQGIRVEPFGLDEDTCRVICVTHNTDLLHNLNQQNEAFLKMLDHPIPVDPTTTLACVVAHPHGHSKKVTFGTQVHIEHIRDVSVTDFLKKFMEIPLSQPFTNTINSIRRSCLCKVQYNIPTCPGSSGAYVKIIHLNDKVITYCSAPHSRHIHDTNVNESGLGVAFYSSLENVIYLTCYCVGECSCHSKTDLSQHRNSLFDRKS